MYIYTYMCVSMQRGSKKLSQVVFDTGLRSFPATRRRSGQHDCLHHQHVIPIDGTVTVWQEISISPNLGTSTQEPTLSKAILKISGGLLQASAQ